jgi:ATP-dependent Clp protease ATP-binding subunit ClpB
MLDNLRSRLAERRIELEVTEQARRHIAQGGFDPVLGVQTLCRYLQREVETRIARTLLSGEVLDVATSTVDPSGGDLTVTWQQPAEVPAAA